MKFVFHMTIWGSDYIDQFINISLPTVLADGNLEGFHYLDDSKFLIFTNEDGRKRLLDEPLFRHLKELVTVDFVIMDALMRNRKFDTVNICQLEGVMRSIDFDALFFIYPDFVWSAGSFNNVANRLAEGYKGVICPVPRLSLESFSKVFDRQKVQAKAGAVSLESREFVALCDPYFHKMMDFYEIRSDRFSFFPSNLSWIIPNEGRLYHCFHSHPIAIRLDKNNPNLFYRFSVSLDEDYLSTLFSSTDCLYMAEDSDEIAICSLTPDVFSISSSPRFESDHIQQLWIWAERYTSILHRSLVRHPYRWHFNDIKLETWREAEHKASQVIETISDRLNLPSEYVKYAERKAFEGRRFRQRRLKKRRSYGSIVRYLFIPNDVGKLKFIHLRHRLYFIILTRLANAVTVIFNIIPFLGTVYLRIRKNSKLVKWFRRHSGKRSLEDSANIRIPFSVDLFNYFGNKLPQGKKK